MTLSLLEENAIVKIDEYGNRTVTIGDIEWWDGRNEEKYRQKRRKRVRRDLPYQLRYVLDPRGNYIVSLLGTNQRIVVLPGKFYRILRDISLDAVLGAYQANLAQVKALGFIVHDTEVIPL